VYPHSYLRYLCLRFSGTRRDVRSCGMWRRITGWLEPGVARERCGFIFKDRNGILHVHFYPWIWEHPVVSKRRAPITRCRVTVFQRYGDVNCTATEVSRLAIIADLHLRSPHHFEWKLSTRVAQTLWSSYLRVTWLQLLCKQTNTGTSTARTAETHWSTRTALSDLWHQSRLADVTHTWSWSLYGINYALHFAYYVSRELWDNSMCAYTHVGL
jgi:hypothetical protein